MNLYNDIYLIKSTNGRVASIETIITKINDGIISDVVASIEPIIPDVFKPAKVATFIPTGPGVIDATAIIWVSSLTEYQPYTSDKWYKKGMVAYPPPKENKPILKNS